MTQASSEPQRYRSAAWWIGLLTILLMLLSAMAQGESGDLSRLRADYVQTPIYFEPNVGQITDPVKFLARGPGYALFLTADEAVLALHPARSGNEPAAVIRTRLEGVARNPEPRLEGLEKLPGISNYLLGKDRAQWRTLVPHYRRVRYAEVYPGVDLVYYGNPQQLEHDFIVAPGADPAQIQLTISGANRVRVNAEGDLILTVPGGEVVQQAPRIYQVINGQQQPVAGRYVLRHLEAAATTVNIAMADPMLEPLRVGFAVAHYDPKQPLVIDPVLAYSTFLGGIKEDYGLSIAVESGYAYVTGATLSIDFPVNDPSLVVDSTIAGTKTTDAFVAKFDFAAAGPASLVYSTYLGGSDDKDDIGYGIAVDSNEYAYVTGTTASKDFPVPGGVLNGGKDAFIVILDSSGGGPLYSTYLGGTKDDEGRGIKQKDPIIYVTGYTNSTDFPLKNPFQQALLGGTDAFVIQIDNSGAPQYSTYLGGVKDDQGTAIAVDDSGNIYLTGSTASANFPVTGSATAFDATLGGTLDAFVAKIDPNKIIGPPNQPGMYSLLYSTYLGGSGADSGAGIAVDSSDKAYVTGTTASSDFPVTSNAAQSNYGGNWDAFITKIDPDLIGINSLIHSTYLGGSGLESGASIAVTENSGAVQTYVTGATASINFPVTSDAYDKSLGGGGDAFVAQINDTGSRWLYVTYLGGNNGIDSGAGIAADSSGIYVTSAAIASDFPTTNNAFDRVIGSSKDAFVVKLEEGVILTVTPIGSGTVKSSNVTGINCRSDCTETYATGAVVELTAAPVSGWAFAGWSGACSGAGTCTVSMTAAKNVTATFTQYFATVGVFRNGGWYLDDNGNGIWDSCSTDLCMSFGQAGDLPIAGDWNGAGKIKIGVFRAGGWFRDDNGNGIWDDSLFTGFGQAGDLPIVGDWNGDGKTKIGVFRPGAGVFYLDYDGNDIWDGCGSGPDRCYTNFVLPGDSPVVGDWDGDGKAEIGVFRNNGLWFLDANGNGIWDGCGTDLCLSFGASGKPVVGDWNNDGKAKVGVFNNGTWYLDYNGNGAWDGCILDRCYYPPASLGLDTDFPVAGHW